jgi:hypothetical protein
MRIGWNVRLLPDQAVKFPVDRPNDPNPYYHARATDSAAVQAEVDIPEDQRHPALRNLAVVQREKFLFYRGAGTFPPPVAIHALGEGKVRVKNSTKLPVKGIVLVTVQGNDVGFHIVGELAAGADRVEVLPRPFGNSNKVEEAMAAELTAVGLYPKEATAMVRTWKHSWFGENGNRVLYLVPRPRADELLPLTITPKPDEITRVLVGRHDFLTPEQEAMTDKHFARVRSMRAELEEAEKALDAVSNGRFAVQGRALSEKRIDGRTSRK